MYKVSFAGKYGYSVNAPLPFTGMCHSMTAKKKNTPYL